MPRKKQAPALSSPIQIGNCEVAVEPSNFTCRLNPHSVELSVSRNAKIKIAVNEVASSQNCNHTQCCKHEETGTKENSFLGDDYFFLLINPKVPDDNCKSPYPEVLNLYRKELPTMKYAANTGKQSTFLERCVSNGKYCTLLLKYKSTEATTEVVSAITFQIIPCDTQYAEIALAAVNSNYQRKGIGSMLYMELRRRLQNVGICSILCWGDKESHGFWFKLGFESVAVTDTKGRACRLPIKADVRRALCFPGNSILMLSHLLKDIEAEFSNCFNLSAPAIKSQDLEKKPGCSPGQNPVEVSREPLPFKEVNSSSMGAVVGVTFGGDPDAKGCSSAMYGVKRVWEASVSSIRSKKVKGGQTNEVQVACDGVNYSCLNKCSLGNLRSTSVNKDTPEDRLTNSPWENIAEGCGRVVAMPMPNDQLSREHEPKGDYFRIMLMNIADDVKKMQLTKIIEGLGGIVTSDGSASTHVIMGKVRKTENFCTALCSGAWILSCNWLKESFRAGKFVDELPFILKDRDYELKYKMELKITVLKSKERPQALLKGYGVCFAPHVQPPIKTLAAIVKSAGGHVISRLEEVEEASRTIFVACDEDMEEALTAVKRGIWTFNCDWLMNCVMKQELDLHAPQFAESL